MYKFITLRRACAALVTLAFSNIASAGLVIDINEVGSDIVANLSGSFTSLPTANVSFGTSTYNRFTSGVPQVGFSNLANGTSVMMWGYTFASPFPTFGPQNVGAYSPQANTSTANTTVQFTGSYLYLLQSYSPGSFSGSLTWNNKSYDDWGVKWEPGSYVGTLTNGETVTMNINSVAPAGVPEPSQVAASLLLLAGIGGYVFMKPRQTAKTAAPVAA